MIDTLLKQYDAQSIIDTLEPHVNDTRRTRIEDTLQKRIHALQIAVESPSDIHNALAIVRTSEAMGLNNVHIINPENRAVKARRITQGSFRWVNLNVHKKTEDYIKLMRQNNILIAGAVVDAEKTIYDVPVDKPICILFGNEHSGLSELAKQSCDMLFTLPMFGMSESLNLSVAAGMSIFELQRRKRKMMPRSTDLSEKEYLEEKALYYLRVSPAKLLQKIFL